MRAGVVGARDVDRRVADCDGALRRPAAGTFARESEELRALFAFASECALPGRKIRCEPEPLHAGVRDGRRISRLTRRTLEYGDRLDRAEVGLTHAHPRLYATT